MTAEHDFYQDDYDEYVENTPLEARFDYLTIQMAVTEAFPKHEAYGMLFADYHRKRSTMQGYDESEKKRLSFRLTSYFSHVAADIALTQKVSMHRAMILLIELGLIHFQVDYHEEYNVIRKWREDFYNNLESKEDLRKYKRVERNVISLESGGRVCPHFTPSVPEWLYNTIMDMKAYLNISSSDLIFFCWCYGCVNCFNDSDIPNIIRDDLLKVCSEFDYEIKEYQKQIELSGVDAL